MAERSRRSESEGSRTVTRMKSNGQGGPAVVSDNWDGEAGKTIERLKKQNKQLRAQIDLERSAFFNVHKEAKMPPATYRAVVKVMHPDQRQHVTAEQLNEACRLFLAWSDGALKSRPKDRRGGR